MSAVAQQCVSTRAQDADSGRERCWSLTVRGGLLRSPGFFEGVKPDRPTACPHPNWPHAEAVYDTATAKAVMSQVLAEHPDIDVVVSSGDQMALGAEQAASEAGATIRIVGFGAGRSAMQQLPLLPAGRTFDAAEAVADRTGPAHGIGSSAVSRASVENVGAIVAKRYGRHNRAVPDGGRLAMPVVATATVRRRP